MLLIQVKFRDACNNHEYMDNPALFSCLDAAMLHIRVTRVERHMLHRTVTHVQVASVEESKPR